MFIELKNLSFSGAHFLIERGKCNRLHGHNWNVKVTVQGEPDKHGLIVDFLELKLILKRILENLDHHLLLPTNNSVLKRLSEGETTRISVRGREFEFPSEDVVWLPVVNTTVEELARIIADEVKKNLAYPNVRRIKVWVEESPGQSATEEREMGADPTRGLVKSKS